MNFLRRLRTRRALLREATAFDREAETIIRQMGHMDASEPERTRLEMKRRVARLSAEHKREEAGRL